MTIGGKSANKAPPSDLMATLWSDSLASSSRSALHSMTTRTARRLQSRMAHASPHQTVIPILNTLLELRAWRRAARAANMEVGVVPTVRLFGARGLHSQQMGALHQGHLDLSEQCLQIGRGAHVSPHLDVPPSLNGDDPLHQPHAVRTDGRPLPIPSRPRSRPLAPLRPRPHGSSTAKSESPAGFRAGK